jgi:hypothetical protein
MSKQLVERIDAQHPQLLQTNVGATCHQFTLLVIEALRAQGAEAFLMCKSPGEGQYVPPGFQQRMVIGLDGREYLCSGVSHDAIWSDDRQFDTIGSANDSDQPIFNSDGQRILGVPTWNEIPQQFWRPSNPPLTEDVPPVPPPPPVELHFPPRDATARFFATLNAFYADQGRHNRVMDGEDLHVDNEGIFVWLGEFQRRYVLGETEAEAVASVLADVAAAWPK